MSKRFEGKVAIVTGGVRGIGLATAQAFAQEGAAVAVCDLAQDAAVSAAAGLTTQFGVRALGLACDVADEAQVDAFVSRVVTELGGLDILVNNAGITRDNLLFKMTVTDWDLVMGVHLRG